MAADRKIVVGSLITLACSLGAAILLLKKKRKHFAWMKKYIREREQYGECVQYMQMDIELGYSRNCYPWLSL